MTTCEEDLLTCRQALNQTHQLTFIVNSDASIRLLCFTFTISALLCFSFLQLLLHFLLFPALCRLLALYILLLLFFILRVRDLVKALQVLCGGVVDGTTSLVHRVLHLKAFVVEHGLETLVNLDLAFFLWHLPESWVLLHPQEALIAVLALLGRHGG